MRLRHQLACSLQEAAGNSKADTGDNEQLLEQLLMANLVADVHAHCHAGSSSSSSKGDAAAPAATVQPSPAELLCWQRRLVLNGVALQPLLSGSFMHRQGLGLYPVAALLNHGCDSNCSIRCGPACSAVTCLASSVACAHVHNVRTLLPSPPPPLVAVGAVCRFVGRTLLLVCVRGAEPGEQLTISYGPQAGQQHTALRQQLLQQQYGFSCRCGACYGGAAVAGREAAAAGLACCSSASTSRRNSSSGSREPGGCTGVVLPSATLPGLVAEHPLAPGHAGVVPADACTACSWRMPPQLLQHKLHELAAAAQAAAEAAALMAQHECSAASSLADGAGSASSSPQQQVLLARACELLGQAAAVRQRHLHRHNQLLGTSHREAAVAAIQAVAASASAGQAHELALLLSSLSMESAAEVCAVAEATQQQMQALGRSATCCACRACAVGGSSGLLSAAQQQHCTCAGSSSAAGPVRARLRLAEQQLGGSIAVLAAQQPGSLALAAEQLVAAAVVVALLGTGHGSAASSAGSTQQQWCCWCTQLWQQARTWHSAAGETVRLHLGHV